MKINKPKQIWQLAFEGDWPTSVTFLSDQNSLAAANRAGQIYLWQLPENPPASIGEKPVNPPDFAPHRRLDGHTNGVTHLRTANDGKTLFSSSLDHSVRIWDLQTSPDGVAQVVLDAKKREAKARRASKAEREKILNAPGAEIEIAKTCHVLTGHDEWVKALNVSGDGKRLISGDDACRTIVWDLASRKQLASWLGYDRVWISSAALSPQGETAFTAEYAGRRSSFDVPAAQARLWHADTGKLKLDLLKTWTPKVKDEDRVDSYGYGRTWGEFFKRGLVCAAISPDGKLLAAGQGGETDTGKIHLIDLESGRIVRSVSGHRYGVCDVKFSADGKHVLSSGRDTTVRICQVADGKEVAALGTSRGGQFKDWLHAVSISPDQKFVAAADIAGMVHVWQLAS